MGFPLCDHKLVATDLHGNKSCAVCKTPLPRRKEPPHKKSEWVVTWTGDPSRKPFYSVMPSFQRAVKFAKYLEAHTEDREELMYEGGVFVGFGKKRPVRSYVDIHVAKVMRSYNREKESEEEEDV
jgi:hypothetical protein